MATTTSISQLCTHEYGPSSGFPILFLHGWGINGPFDALDFEPVFSTYDNDDSTASAAASTGRFPISFRRIYLDLPAHGRSPTLNVQNLDDILTHVCQYIDTRFTRTQQRFLLAGTSAGGYLAQAIVQRYASQIDGLLLRVPLVEPDNARRDLDSFKALVVDESVTRGLTEAERESWGGEVLVQTPEYVEGLRRKWQDGLLPATREGHQGVLAGIRGNVGRYRLGDLSGEGAEEMRVFEAPTLVVDGRQDGVTGYRDSLRLLERYPRSTFVVLDRAGHDLPVDQGEVFAALVKDWLVRVVEWQKRLQH